MLDQGQDRLGFDLVRLVVLDVLKLRQGFVLTSLNFFLLLWLRCPLFLLFFLLLSDERISFLLVSDPLEYLVHLLLQAVNLGVRNEGAQLLTLERDLLDEKQELFADYDPEVRLSEEVLRVLIDLHRLVLLLPVAYELLVPRFPVEGL